MRIVLLTIGGLLLIYGVGLFLAVGSYNGEKEKSAVIIALGLVILGLGIWRFLT